MKVDSKVNLKVDPKIVKMASRRVFCPTEETLNSASLFFLHLVLSGTPGPSPIVQIPCKYHHFRDASLSQQKAQLFGKRCQKWPPRRPLKAPEITKNWFGKLFGNICFLHGFLIANFLENDPKMEHPVHDFWWFFWTFFLLWRSWVIFDHPWSFPVSFFVMFEHFRDHFGHSFYTTSSTLSALGAVSDTCFYQSSFTFFLNVHCFCFCFRFCSSLCCLMFEAARA